MTKEFNEITSKILKTINEQNKKLENLENKIEKVAIEAMQDYLSSEEVIIDSSPKPENVSKIVLKGIETEIKELKEELSKNNELNDKVIALGKENEELKEKLSLMQENFSKYDELFKNFEEKLQVMETTSSATTLTELATQDNLDDGEQKQEQAINKIEKEGKVINITINV